MKYIAPSILSADFAKLGTEVQAVEAAGADWIHVDVMDGQFVPNITMGPLVVEAVRRSTRLTIDVHLMIKSPERYVADFADAGADYIAVHQEACTHLHRTVQQIREKGAKPGVALNPATPVESLQWIIEDLDFVLVMSVNPGFGGQKFIPSALDKVARLKEMIRERGLSTLIQIDGGVNAGTIGGISQAGVDVFVAGSAVFGSEDYGRTISELKANW
ncbi:ribulose-phosphate 3-epimerase [uncultured Desulfosarcina sp.]|uniref:ribulose-phosphate 3-epimerase n=1 Tax=uncultured Desulfosarcina sp. TaxID=218289 RepID=UPI0029C8AFB9|nr:ribulose-phosphate 3-epimerase [uncultured Desulfosarcina sp.]